MQNNFKMIRLDLLNSERLVLEYEKFELFDSEKEYNNLKVDDLVIVTTEEFSLWIKVKEIINRYLIIGTVDTDISLDRSDIKIGDEIEFSFCNIKDILKEEVRDNKELNDFIVKETFVFIEEGISFCTCCNIPLYLNAYNKYYAEKEEKENS